VAVQITPSNSLICYELEQRWSLCQEFQSPVLKQETDQGVKRGRKDQVKSGFSSENAWLILHFHEGVEIPAMIVTNMLHLPVFIKYMM